MRYVIVAGALLAACTTTVSTAPVYSLDTAPPSEVRQEADIVGGAGNWGTFYQYYREATPIVDDVNVGVAKIKAGVNAPHPPHKHAEEEYIMVTRGRGTWFLNGETFAANEGDILYARSWDYHGIQSAEDSPLDFVIFKYTGTAHDMPEAPDPSSPLEIPFP